MRISVIGAGSWGTAVSWLLGGKGHSVSLWSREAEIAEGINALHRNPLYLKDIVMPESVKATVDFEEALRGAEAIVVVTPSHGVRETASMMAPYVDSTMPVLTLAKGVEHGTHLRMSEVLAEELGHPDRIAALSGPNHAEEVSKGVPSATVVASTNDSVSRLFRDAFMAPAFRVYTNPDIVGVELAGASKNVVAVAAGLSDGLGYGDNTKATLMTRGLAEMTRLGTTLGANPLTYMGLAGMGDLIATCTSRHSRNRGLGEHVATGGTITSYAEQTKMIAEGATSCITVFDLGESRGVELPITAEVRAVLHEGKAPMDAGAALMGRAAVDELHGMDLVYGEA